MSEHKVLSGEDLVKKGVTSLEASLPELGLKDVVPNGSWLEKKQIQAAIEEKKHLIEIERIEKRGSISQANWIDKLGLAEVCQKVGGYWQYLGHNVGPILYLNPEEALFLMEINCLQLNYGDVKVSLQQAYSLLLCGDMTLLKYKVYASLSRVGYKVLKFRSTPKEDTQQIKDNEIKHFKGTLISKLSTEKSNEISILNEDPNPDDSTNHLDPETNNISSYINNSYCNTDQGNSCHKMSETYKNVIESYHHKLNKMKNRTIKQISIENVNNSFTNIPELLEKRIVTLKVPEARFLPENMKLNETYTVNLQNVHKKCIKTCNRTNSDGEVNNSHIGGLAPDSTNAKSDINTNSTQTSVHTQTSSLSQNCTQSQNEIPSVHYTSNNDRHRNYEHPQYLPLFYSRPQNLNYFNFNMIFDNTLNHLYIPPYQCYGRQVCPGPSINYCNSSAMYNQMPISTIPRGNHFQRIKDLAERMKSLVSRSNFNKSHIRALKNLLNTYNSRYKTNLRLSSDFEILNEASVIAKIDLDVDDDEPQNKKAKTDNFLEENLQAIRKIGLELKDLEINGKATASHRRSMSKLIKTFNDSYNVEYHLTPEYEVLNRADVYPATEMVTNCEDVNKIDKPKKSKKLRNPYNILKRLSENQGAGTSKINLYSIPKTNQLQNRSEVNIVAENNFDRKEVPNEIGDPLFDSRKTQLLYEFMKFKPDNLNWCQSKIAFLESLVETIVEFSEVSNRHNNFDEDCLLSPDCTNAKSVMDKLRVIKTNKDISTECRLHIDFDVYNRDIENYSKKNPPKPHFRVICLDESFEIPSATEIEALQNHYEDNIPIVFALVSSSSISYLQVKSTEIPIFQSTSTMQ